VRSLSRFIEKRLEHGDKILVIVDNVHSERTSAIFYTNRYQIWTLVGPLLGTPSSVPDSC